MTEEYLVVFQHIWCTDSRDITLHVKQKQTVENNKCTSSISRSILLLEIQIKQCCFIFTCLCDTGSYWESIMGSKEVVQQFTFEWRSFKINLPSASLSLLHQLDLNDRLTLVQSKGQKSSYVQRVVKHISCLINTWLFALQTTVSTANLTLFIINENLTGAPQYFLVFVLDIFKHSGNGMHMKKSQSWLNLVHLYLNVD